MKRVLALRKMNVTQPTAHNGMISITSCLAKSCSIYPPNNG